MVLEKEISGELVPNFPKRGVTNHNGKFCERPTVTPAVQFKCYSTHWNKIFLTTVLGEYYLSTKLHLVPNPIPSLRLIQRNPYCAIQSKKPILDADSRSTNQVLGRNSSTYQRGLAYLRANVTTGLQRFDNGFSDFISTPFLHKNFVRK